jgi:hypothetical protein
MLLVLLALLCGCSGCGLPLSPLTSHCRGPHKLFEILIEDGLGGGLLTGLHLPARFKHPLAVSHYGYGAELFSQRLA